MDDYLKKLLLRGFVLLGGIFLCIPSLLLVQTLETYWKFLNAHPQEVLRQQTVKNVPRSLRNSIREEILPSFESFRIYAPHAKSVLLAGDFNHWKPERHPLSKDKKGFWETLVPLPGGRYRYRFKVDGQWVLDPQNPNVDRSGSLPSSVRVVPSSSSRQTRRNPSCTGETA